MTHGHHPIRLIGRVADCITLKQSSVRQEGVRQQRDEDHAPAMTAERLDKSDNVPHQDRVNEDFYGIVYGVRDHRAGNCAA